IRAEERGVITQGEKLRIVVENYGSRGGIDRGGPPEGKSGGRGIADRKVLGGAGDVANREVLGGDRGETKAMIEFSFLRGMIE
ncbi:hypothetical protein KI387_008151, partial [Taxus chinensis]